ncbi:hypothetical protein NDU88_000509 [Pleurodeles waltl]|uniref:Uncharacterized protein n=1 Tax=Pleurodeles waltl TaxID=8319 RepID=A0AAV7S774_PLEWA|nr:hypothetical protein NDU88_000509 [Pleurodeles waltl]
MTGEEDAGPEMIDWGDATHETLDPRRGRGGGQRSRGWGERRNAIQDGLGSPQRRSLGATAMLPEDKEHVKAGPLERSTASRVMQSHKKAQQQKEQCSSIEGEVRTWKWRQGNKGRREKTMRDPRGSNRGDTGSQKEEEEEAKDAEAGAKGPENNVQCCWITATGEYAGVLYASASPAKA